jgi:hypothetical protein
MINNKEPVLELIPYIKQAEEEKKEAEAKLNSNQQLPLESNKNQQSLGQKEKKNIKSELIEKRKDMFKKKAKMEKNLYHRHHNSLVSLPYDDLFYDSSSLLNEKDGKKDELQNKEDELLNKEFKEENIKMPDLFMMDMSPESDNKKNIYGYSSKETKNPVKNRLLEKIEELRRKQILIEIQFKNDSDTYKRKISILESACNSSFSEDALKKLEKVNKENKECIKNYKRLIEQKEKEKIEDKKNFYNNLNEIIELKATLLEELKELEILAKNTSFQDYDEFLRDNPTKIDKLNFRANDSRYLLTNEYETSHEEESYSSYEKLNHINNTPEGFDINKQNNTFDKTEQYFFNTKNFVGTVESNNHNNSFYNNRINHSFVIRHKKHNISNKELVNYSFKKNETLNEMKSKKNLIEINKKDTKDKGLSSFNVNNDNQHQNFINKTLSNKQQRKKPLNFNNNNSVPQDPDFLNNDMILIRQDENFY